LALFRARPPLNNVATQSGWPNPNRKPFPIPNL
jgi:hypothetical protein